MSKYKREYHGEFNSDGGKIDFTVEYYYTPAQRSTRDDPPCDAKVIIIKATPDVDAILTIDNDSLIEYYSYIDSEKLVDDIRQHEKNLNEIAREALE